MITDRLVQDMGHLVAGRMPQPLLLDMAPLLSWWHVERSIAGLYLAGTVKIRPVSTDTLCWMDAEFRWCRCESGWWRLGEFELEIPMDLEL